MYATSNQKVAQQALNHISALCILSNDIWDILHQMHINNDSLDNIINYIVQISIHIN